METPDGLATARRVVDENACAMTGHRFTIVEVFGGEPVAITCDRDCGHGPWRVVA